MRKNLITTVLLLCLSISSFAQSDKSVKDTPLKRHSVYFEYGGNSYIYSINYDYTFQLSDLTKLAIGSGFEYFKQYWLSKDNNGNNFIITPAANLLIGRTSHHFETGLATAFDLSGGSIAPSVRLGYRYQPRKGGFLFRIGATPLIASDKIVPWGGVSVGYTF